MIDALTTLGQTPSPASVTGTSNPPYQIYSEREQGQNYSTNFHAITMMPAYRNASFEVLTLHSTYLTHRNYGWLITHKDEDSGHKQVSEVPPLSAEQAPQLPQ